MYSNSNSLGIGSTGNTFSLVPTNMQIPQRGKITNNKINQISYKSKGQFRNNFNNSNTLNMVNNQNSINSNEINMENNQNDSILLNKSIEVDNSNLFQQSDQTELAEPSNLNDTTDQLDQLDQLDQQEQSPSNPENFWNETFRNIASNQLYGAFRKVKGIINSSNNFEDTRLTYINYDAMQLLINKAKRDKYKRGVMSLKTYLTSEGQNTIDPNHIQTATGLTNIMEILGPTDHAVTPINSEQLNFLKENNFKEYYWPNGSNGITWLTKAQTGNWNG